MTRKYLYKTLTMPDGRTIAYTEFGDPKGYPVINCHGGLVNRLDISWADKAAKKHKIRVISPDRPGVGYSTPQKGRTLQDWSNDVERICDQLNIKKFGVMGWSMGGQYALAVANFLPRRVSHLVLIAACLDLSRRKNFSELNPMDKRLSQFAHRVPWLAWICYFLLGVFTRIAPGTWRRVSARQLGDCDREIVGDPNFDFVTPTKEALRKPSGMIEEYRVFDRAWGFSLRDIAVPTSIWQGNDDKLVPYKWALAFSNEIPNSQLHMIDEAGHFVAHQEIDTIFESFK